MRIEYLIDGYNLLHARGEGQRRPGPGNLEKARAALLRWLAARLPDPGCATVVFDAPDHLLAERRVIEREADGVHVLFAAGYETADELIAELCRRHSFPKQLVVVSNDRWVQRSARRRRARAETCEEFQRRLETLPRTAAPAEPIEKLVGPTPPEREHWLRVFAELELAPPKRHQRHP